MYFPNIYRDAAIGNGARLELFSGNPIPFSIVALGLSIMSLTSWRKDGQKERFQSVFCLFIGLYLALYLANSRGTILAFILNMPVIFWFIFKSVKSSIALFIGGIATIFLAFELQVSGLINSDHIFRIIKGLKTLTKLTPNGNNLLFQINWSKNKTIINQNVYSFSIENLWNFSSLLCLPHENKFS